MGSVNVTNPDPDPQTSAAAMTCVCDTFRRYDPMTRPTAARAAWNAAVAGECCNHAILPEINKV